MKNASAKMRNAGINLLKEKDNGKKKSHEFIRCINQWWTDEEVERFAKMSFDERRLLLKDVLDEFGATDVEVFVKASYEREGIKAPYRSFKSGRNPDFDDDEE